jgi:DNA repair protein RadC
MGKSLHKKVAEASQYHVKITDLPEGERPQEKLMKYGADSLSDTELLAILIRSGTGKITAVDLAKINLEGFSFTRWHGF